MMYIVPMKIAVTTEIEAPVYIDLQTVRRADGLKRFQAMARFSSYSSSSSFSSHEHALMTLTLSRPLVR